MRQRRAVFALGGARKARAAADSDDGVRERKKILLAAFCGETVDHCDCGARPDSIFASPGSYTVIAGMGQLITALRSPCD